MLYIVALCLLAVFNTLCCSLANNDMETVLSMLKYSCSICTKECYFNHFFYIMNVVSPLDAHPAALQWVQRGRVVAAGRETEYIDTMSSGPDSHCTEQVFA